MRIFLFLSLCLCLLIGCERTKIKSGSVDFAQLTNGTQRAWRISEAKENGEPLNLYACELDDSTVFIQQDSLGVRYFGTVACDTNNVLDASKFIWKWNAGKKELTFIRYKDSFLGRIYIDTTSQFIYELTSTKLRTGYSTDGNYRYEVTYRPLN